jgi:arginine deiminase
MARNRKTGDTSPNCSGDEFPQSDSAFIGMGSRTPNASLTKEAQLEEIEMLDKSE